MSYDTESYDTERDFLTGGDAARWASKTPENSWMSMFSGVRVHPFAPEKTPTNFFDVARGLANIARFNGQTSSFYSVAQHSVMGSHFAEACMGIDDARRFIVHDMAEYVVGDQVRPIKIHLDDFNTVESRIKAHICNQLLEAGYDLGGLDGDSVRNIDNIMVAWEKRDLLPNSEEWGGLPDLKVAEAMSGWVFEEINPLAPDLAYSSFVLRMKELFPNVMETSFD